MRGATIEEEKNMDHITYPLIYNLLTTEELKKYQSHKSLQMAQLVFKPYCSRKILKK
jgi:hypothetical protein